MKSREKIYRLEIAIKGLSPTIWRDVVVPGDYSLRDLHLVLQSAMGWENCHRHAFALGNEPFPLDDAGSTEHEAYEAETKIADLLKRNGPALRYLYDFNDNWEHTVSVKTVYKRNPRHFYPNCLGGEMTCPPEDVGGVKTFKQLLKALDDPEEADKGSLVDKDLLTWYSDFKPAFFSQTECNERLKLWDTMSWGTDFDMDLKDGDEEDDDSVKHTETLIHEDIVELDDDDVELMDVAARKTSRPPKRVVKYDPSAGPDFGSWLDLSEEETILATKKYHDDHEPETDIGSAIIHAAMHAVVETQIAMIDPPQVHRAFTKLVDGELDRHEAIHIIGAVLAEQLYHLMELQKSAQYNPYGRSLAELDVKKWKMYYSELKNPSEAKETGANETQGTMQIRSDELLELQETAQPDESADREEVSDPQTDGENGEHVEERDSRSSIGDLKLDLDSEVIMALNAEVEMDEPENSVDDLKLNLDPEVVMAIDDVDAAESEDDPEPQDDATVDDDEITEEDLEVEAFSKPEKTNPSDQPEDAEEATESEDDPEPQDDEAH